MAASEGSSSRTTVRSTAAGGLAVVALAASLWGTDGLIRGQLALELSPAVLVFYEHLLLVILLAPVLWKVGPVVRRLDTRQRIALLVIGVGASAIATALFTAAFRAAGPTTPLLLQKVQPLVAVVAARVLLGERTGPRFGLYLGAGLVGAVLISVPDPTAASWADARGGLFALGAAVLWAFGTVLGRFLSDTIAPKELTALRFAVGLPAAAVVLLAQHGPSGVGEVAGDDLVPLLLLVLIPGLLAMRLYYVGLAGAPASGATIAELAFPLTAVIIGRFVLGDVLTASQWVGLGLLLATVVALSLAGRAGSKRIGVVVEEPLSARG
jgi:drug/metabolite transporter, DME family